MMFCVALFIAFDANYVFASFCLSCDANGATQIVLFLLVVAVIQGAMIHFVNLHVYIYFISSKIMILCFKDTSLMMTLCSHLMLRVKFYTSFESNHEARSKREFGYPSM